MGPPGFTSLRFFIHSAIVTHSPPAQERNAAHTHPRPPLSLPVLHLVRSDSKEFRLTAEAPFFHVSPLSTKQYFFPPFYKREITLFFLSWSCFVSFSVKKEKLKCKSFMIKRLKELMDIFSKEIRDTTANPKESLTH